MRIESSDTYFYTRVFDAMVLCLLYVNIQCTRVIAVTFIRAIRIVVSRSLIIVVSINCLTGNCLYIYVCVCAHMHLYILSSAYLISKVNDIMVYMMNFQDGSYSRGPVDIPVGEVDDSNYYLSPTFKFEQVSLACFGSAMELFNDT